MRFTGDFVLIQISPATATPAPAAPRAAPVAGVSSFAVALATVLVPGAPAEVGETLLPGGQAIAAGGKKLPELDLDEKPGDGDADKDSDPDPAFAWFAAPVAAEPARTGFAPAAKPAPRPVTPGEAAPMEAQPVVEGAKPQKGGPVPDAVPADDGAVLATGKAVPAATIAPSVEAAPKPVFQAKADAAQPAAPPQPVAAPAVEVPALSNHPVATPTVTFSLDVPLAPRRPVGEAVDAIFTPAAPDAPSAPAIAAPADMQQAALDTRRHEWMGSMIDRIETMRDASATGDTRIRLAPDALGQVDISIRHEGDRIHVHFATETQAARQLLSDAQPRLSELAEARGVKLGQTSVDGGAAGSGQQQNAATRQPTPPRPAGAAAEAAADTDQRIA